jgi:DNA-binding transcriptional regulator YdaS (Cro superfamily)
MLLIRAMRLGEWLKKTRTRKYAFAARIGVSASIISDYCNERSWPSRDKMEAIYRETGGEVTANDFLREKELECRA